MTSWIKPGFLSLSMPCRSPLCYGRLSFSLYPTLFGGSALSLLPFSFYCMCPRSSLPGPVSKDLLRWLVLLRCLHLLNFLDVQGCIWLGAHLGCNVPWGFGQRGSSASLVFFPGSASWSLLLETLNAMPFLVFHFKLPGQSELTPWGTCSLAPGASLFP